MVRGGDYLWRSGQASWKRWRLNSTLHFKSWPLGPSFFPLRLPLKVIWKLWGTRGWEPGGLQSMGSLRIGHDWATSLLCIGEGNGNPLQCSCLENSRDGGAWWAAVYGVAQSWTRLKRLSSSSSRGWEEIGEEAREPQRACPKPL